MKGPFVAVPTGDLPWWILDGDTHIRLCTVGGEDESYARHVADLLNCTDLKELAADLRKRAEEARKLQLSPGGLEATDEARLRGKASGYDHSAELVEALISRLGGP